MRLFLNELRHNRLLWLLVFVPVLFIVEKLKPEAHVVISYYDLDKKGRVATWIRPGEMPKQLAPDAMEVLMNYNWAGNIRQLENSIERACMTTRGLRQAASTMAHTEPFPLVPATRAPRNPSWGSPRRCSRAATRSRPGRMPRDPVAVSHSRLSR